MGGFLRKGGWIVVALAAIVFRAIGQYNAIINLDEEVNKAWANVEAQYQRRADLIPNLVKTVQAFADQENQVLTEVTEARTKATSVNVNLDDPSSLEQFAEAQGQLSQGLGRLLAVAENYPELKSNENFLDLQKQLEGTENRIAVARGAYNQAVKDYSTTIRKFPINLIASQFGFESKEGFEADEGAENSPEVEFDI